MMPLLSDLFAGASLEGFPEVLAHEMIGIKVDIVLENDIGQTVTRTVTVNAPGSASISDVMDAAVQGVAAGAFETRRGRAYNYTIVEAEVVDIFFSPIENPLITL